MRKSFLKTILVCIIFISAAASYCQDNSGNNQQTSAEGNLEEELPPLENLIAIALKNSPLLKQKEAVIEKNEEAITLAKRSWQDNIGAFGNYSVGNQQFLIAGADGNLQNGFLNGYRAGVNVYVPLSLFTTREAKVRIAESELKAVEFEKEQTELELKNMIIHEYYELLALNNVLKIRSDAKENAALQRQMADKSFAEGTISLDEYSSVGRSVSRAEVEYEVAKGDFLTKYKQFEQLLGVSLENLRRR